MRKISPPKALIHAFRSVRNYIVVGIRFSLLWTVILAALSVANLLANPAADNPEAPPQVTSLEVVSAIVGLVAFCSIAVNWHRFIFRDETGGRPMRLDGDVWRYLGNLLLVVVMAMLPLVVLAVALTFMPPMASVLLAPAAIVAGTFALALSIKLPAVALGRKDFGFRDALNATQDNFWQLMGVFLINGLFLLILATILVAIVSAIMTMSYVLGAIVGLGLSAALNIFYTLFSISVVSSLYGFYVEKRDF
jgi:hypothetical protein